MARAKLPPDVKRTKEIRVPVSPIEKQEIADLAAWKGIAITQVLRCAAMAEVRSAKAERGRKKTKAA